MDNSDFKDSHNYLHSEITAKILQCFYLVYNHTGYGFEKNIYIKSLHIEFQKAGLKSETYKNVELYYQEHDIGNFTADMQVEDKVLIKIGTQEDLSQTDELVLYNHLKTSILEVGLLLNFGISPMQRRKTFLNDNKSNIS